VKTARPPVSWTVKEAVMNIFLVIAAVAGIILSIYLWWSVMFPERF
jgi:hypothetical protein